MVYTYKKKSTREEWAKYQMLQIIKSVRKEKVDETKRKK